MSKSAVSEPAASRKKSPRLSPRTTDAIGLVAAPLLFLVLAAPCLQFSYLSDDLTLLNRALGLQLQDLLPDPRSAFYRPLSREVYFGLLRLIGGQNPIVGHILNTVLVVGAILLISSLARRMLGASAGLLAGLFFAAFAPLPFLVGWVSCSQDILAILFLAAALRFQLGGRTTLALIFSAAALLSKESAIFAFPALAGMRFLLDRSTSNLRKNSLQYGALALTWGLLSPEIRGLLGHGVATGQGGYVGLDNPRALQNLSSMASTMVNVPPTGLSTPWPAELTGTAVAALGIAIALLWAEASTPKKRETSPFPLGRVAAVGLLLSTVPAILTIFWTKHWFPYYACLPAVGVSLLSAAVGRRIGLRGGLFLFLAFLGLGIWYRGMDPGSEGRPAERNWRILSGRLKTVESGLLKLHPVLPAGSRLYMDIQTPIAMQLHSQLFTYQAAGTWYDDPTVLTFDVAQFPRNQLHAFVFWVAPDCNIFEIEQPSLRVRTAGPPPGELDYQKALRRLALGLYRSGAVDRATAILLGMRAPDRVARDFDRRLAAMLLFGAGRTPEATRIRDSTATQSSEVALMALGAALGSVSGSDDLDAPAFEAFGVSPSSAESYRYLMNFFSDRAQLEQALRMANHLLSLRPGDEEATLMRKAILAVPRWEQGLALPETPTPSN